MTPEQFCYWLQGRAEMQPGIPPSKAEWKMIAEHLATVFDKVTPGLTRDWHRYISQPPSPMTPNNPPYRVECVTSADSSAIMQC